MKLSVQGLFCIFYLEQLVFSSVFIFVFVFVLVFVFALLQMHWAAVKAGVPCQSALEWKLFVAYFVVILCAGDRRHSSRAFGKLYII